MIFSGWGGQADGRELLRTEPRTGRDFVVLLTGIEKRETVGRMTVWEGVVPKDQVFCLHAWCSKKNLLGPWNMRSPWIDAILLNCGVNALRVPVP